MDKNTLERMQVDEGSGNIFQDLGFHDAPEMLVKAQLASQIIRALREHGFNQQQAAQHVGLKQPDISNIVNARLDGISVERLFNVLNKLGRSVEIRVSEKETENANTLVLTA